MGKKDILNYILSYIEENLDQDISLDGIAGEVCYSKFYIARIFKENIGCTLYKYVQGRRLTEAARQLAETDKPIAEIAFEAHYASQQAFTKAFHQEYLYTPQIYRRNKAFCPKQSKMTIKSAARGSCGSCWHMGGRMAA